MKKTFVILVYWWCIMYPSLALGPVCNKEMVLEKPTNYEFRLGIVETLKKFSCK